MGFKFIATGSYLPPKVLTNFDLEHMVDTSDEWIRERTGIRERRIASKEMATSDMVTFAAEAALKRGNISKDEIDGVIVATVTPDHAYPSTACWVQKNLGLRKIAAFDINAACSGFLYGMLVAQGLLNTGVCTKIILSGAETMSKAVNWDDRETCVLFGDGAGVCIVENSNDDSDIIASYWAADGSIGDLLMQPAGGSRLPPSHETIEKKLHGVKMKGREVFKYAVRYMGEAADIVLKKAGLTVADIDLYVPHQANFRIIDATCRRLGIPLEKTVITIDRYANIPAATIPISLDDAVKSGRLKRGDIALIVTFGGGFTWGAALVRW